MRRPLTRWRYDTNVRTCTFSVPSFLKKRKYTYVITTLRVCARLCAPLQILNQLTNFQEADIRHIYIYIYIYYISTWSRLHTVDGFTGFVDEQAALPRQWRETVIVPIHRKGDKTHSDNYRGIPLQSTSYKTLANILLSGLIPYAYEIIRNYKFGFRRNQSTDQIFYICQLSYWESVVKEISYSNSYSRRYWRKWGSIIIQYISYL
jgi:hypothetical protein